MRAHLQALAAGGRPTESFIFPLITQKICMSLRTYLHPQLSGAQERSLKTVGAKSQVQFRAVNSVVTVLSYLVFVVWDFTRTKLDTWMFLPSSLKVKYEESQSRQVLLLWRKSEISSLQLCKTYIENKWQNMSRITQIKCIHVMVFIHIHVCVVEYCKTWKSVHFLCLETVSETEMKYWWTCWVKTVMGDNTNEVSLKQGQWYQHYMSINILLVSFSVFPSVHHSSWHISQISFSSWF